MTTTEPADVPLESFDRLWNYAEPAATRERFLARLPEAEAREEPELAAELMTQIGRTLGLERKFDAALEWLDRAETLIAGRPPSVAHVRILLERGRRLNSSGERAASIPLFDRAFELAGRLRAEFHHVDAAHMLGIVEEPTKALEWNERAIALAEAATDPRARGWLGALYNNTGWTHHDAGRYDRALDLFQRALELRERAGQVTETRIARWTIARTHRSMGRYEEALAAQRALQAEHEQADSKHPFVLEEIGENLWALGREDEARPYFERAIPDLRALGWVEEERIASLEERSRGASDTDA